jgi:hypothetical protein
MILDKRLKIDLKKLEVVKDWLIPKSTKGVKGFLGFANFIKKFIKKYNKIVVLFIALYHNSNNPGNRSLAG